MRRFLLVTLLSLAACSKAPERQSIANNAAMLQDALEAEADNMEAMADNAADPATEQALENAADRLEDMKGDIKRDARTAERNVGR